MIFHAGIERALAYRDVVAHGNALQLGAVRKGIIARRNAVRQRRRRNIRIGKGVFSYRFRLGYIGRVRKRRIRKRIRAYVFQLAERRLFEIDTIGKGIVAHRRNLRSVHFEHRCVLRKRARRNRFRVGKRYDIRQSFGRGNDQFVAFINISAAVFHGEIIVGRRDVEFTRFRPRKGVFADDGYVLAEAHVFQRRAVTERVRRNYGSVDIDGKEVFTFRKGIFARLHLGGGKFHAGQFLVGVKRAYTYGLRRFGQHHHIQFTIFKGVISNRNQRRRLRRASFAVRKIILQIATGKCALVDKLHLFKIDLRKFFTVFKRSLPDEVQRRGQHHFFQRRQFGERIRFNRGYAFGDHHFGNRVLAEGGLFCIIRRFFIDDVACGNVFIHKFVARESVRPYGGYPAVCGNRHFAAQPFIGIEINTCDVVRIFYRYRHGKHIQRGIAVVGNGGGNRGSALFFRHDRTVFRNGCVAVT